MARTNTQAVTRLHNVGAIHEAIIAAFPKILADVNYRKELEEEHIKPVKEDITKAFKTLSNDTGIRLEELKLFFKIYEREQVAETFEDDDDRIKVRDGLRLLFGAMKEGEVLNFLDVLEDKDFQPNRLKQDAAMAAGAAAEANADAAAVGNKQTKH